MNYLSVNNLSKTFGVKNLFNNINFHVNEGDQIALVAKNGSGKSTLLKILAQKDMPDSGDIQLNKEIKVVLFEQVDHFEEQLKAQDYIFNHSHPILNIIYNYEKLILKDPTNPKIVEYVEQIDHLEGWKIESVIKEIISKLKIDFLNQEIKYLSGGQRKRIALAKFLIDISLEKGHLLLILDEPTNHLDIDMIEWLEFFLNKENKTLILVTHDRYFLDSICNRILELEDQTLYTHNGDYEIYVRNKAARIENQLAQKDKAKNLYRKELEWMSRQPQARTSKSKSRIADFYKTEEKAKQKIEDKQINLDIQMKRLGKKIIEMNQVSKSFGNKVILNQFTHLFARGSKIGIIGKNGIGKTTFLNILENKEKIDSGSIEWGETIHIGYFEQNGIKLKEDRRIIDYVKEIADYFPLSNGKQLVASAFLEMFLFPAEAQYTYISKLSGGERKRLQLLSVLFKNPNFLILDEPTNDLDLPTLTVLENFLRHYQGCLLVVSHDRYFMDKVVDELMVFEGNGKISWFIGNYTRYFLDQKEKNLAKNKEIKRAPVIENSLSIKKQKLSFKEEKELKNLEKDLSFLEKEKTRLSRLLSENNSSYEEIKKIGDQLQKIVEEIELKEIRWLELSELA